MYFHLKGFITDVIIQMNAPVKYDNQGSKSLSLQTNITWGRQFQKLLTVLAYAHRPPEKESRITALSL